MRDFYDKYVRWIGGTVLIAIVLAAMYGFGPTRDLLPVLCGAGDRTCFRDWVSATSGWAAAIAVAITILYMQWQLQTQRQQAAFTLGDALPTVDIQQEGSWLVVAMVNWNRRAVLVESVDARGVRTPIFTPQPQVFYSELMREHYTADVHVPLQREEKVAVAIGGWISRQETPPIAKILTIVADWSADLSEPHLERRIEIDVSFRIIGLPGRFTAAAVAFAPA
jgi:hypothetical protein